jgi:hypothetical protein
MSELRATITNIATLPREHWVTITLPRPLAVSLGAECTFLTDTGARWRAVRGRTMGLKTVYRIRAYLGGSERVQGTLLNEPHPSAEPYQFHTWVTDDLTALVPSMGARVNGADHWDSPLSGLPVLIDQSAAHTRWWLRRWIPQLGLIFEYWADVLHKDPVVNFWGKVVWSNRNDPNTNKQFDFLALKAGEYMALDFARRNGSNPPFRDQFGMYGVVLNSAPVVLNDGAGLPLSGNMLAFISPGASDPVPADPGNMSDPVVRSIANLYAGAQGPIRGVSHDWHGYWLAARNLPRFGPAYTSRRELEWQQFLDMLQVPTGWTADRPVGIGRTPGQTGGQEDFGATKGTYMVAERDPRWLQAFQYTNQSELFRGFNHYEANATPLNLDAHPQWVTWSGATHYHPGVSPDRLGKGPGLVPGTGWYGYDDQHRSQNGLAAYLTLTDDPLIEDQLKHMVTTDAASYRMRYPNNGVDSPRGQGRPLGAWAHFTLLFDGPERQKWVNIVTAHLNASLANPSLNVSGPMKCLGWGGPDGRKQVYLPNGELGRYMSMWEHGLAVVGLYNTVKAQPSNATAREILLRVCRMMLQFAFFEENGTWWTVADLLWNDGEAPPGGLVSTNRALVTAPGAGDVNSWTFAGLLVVREVLAAENPPRLGDLTRYIAAITGGQEASNRMEAEWWAAVDTVQFPMP